MSRRRPLITKTCQKCGASIGWQMTIEGKWEPVNLDGSRHSSTCPHAAVFRVRKQELVKRILARRDEIEAEKGTLPESWPLIREDRER